MALSAASILVTVGLKYAVLGFTEARLELNSLYGPSVWGSMLSIWSAAVDLTGIGLRISGVLRRTGLVVAIIAAGFVLALLAACAPWLAGPGRPGRGSASSPAAMRSSTQH